MRLRNLISIAGVVAVVAIAVAISGCGGSSDNNSTTQASSMPTGGSTTPASSANTGSAASSTVDVGNTNLGKILVDAQGRTLYLFEKDKGARSTCFGACASAWPPLTTTGGREV
jgi:predicted lipoprotein with Yx(FWY)xxD motif